jgi:hypothetical protein
LLMGRPIAVARASLNLEEQGYPAIDQDWNVFRQDMERAFRNESKDRKRETEDYTKVEIPIRIGEYKQLNDGLVGYWIEEDGRYRENIFYAPQTAPETDLPATIAVHRDQQPLNITQSINSPPHKLTLLLDPRGAVHATSGILPTKAIQIPADMFVDALRNIEVTFLSAPILTDRGRGKINLPLPDEPGYVWSWCEKENGVWESVTQIGQVATGPTAAPQEPVRAPSEDVTEEEIDQTIDGLRERHATFSDVTGRTLELREGWLKLTEKRQTMNLRSSL